MLNILTFAGVREYIVLHGLFWEGAQILASIYLSCTCSSVLKILAQFGERNHGNQEVYYPHCIVANDNQEISHYYIKVRETKHA